MSKVERTGEEGQMRKSVRRRKINWLENRMRRDCLLRWQLGCGEEKANGVKYTGRRRCRTANSIKIGGGYEKNERARDVEGCHPRVPACDKRKTIDTNYVNPFSGLVLH